jgi:hypothetical protein
VSICKQPNGTKNGMLTTAQLVQVQNTVQWGTCLASEQWAGRSVGLSRAGSKRLWRCGHKRYAGRCGTVESLRREGSGQRWAAVVAAWVVVECRVLQR